MIIAIKNSTKKNSIAKMIVYLYTIFALFGGAFSVELNGITLIPYRILSALLCVPIIIISLVFIFKRQNNYLQRTILCILIIVLIMSSISLAWSVDYSGYLVKNFFVITGIGCVSAFTVFSDWVNIWSVLNIIRIGLVVHLFLALFEILFNKYFFLTEEISREYGKYNYSVSSFGNPNDFAAFLNLGFFVCLMFFICQKRHKFLNVLILLFDFVILLFTKSRANIVGVVSALAIILIVYFVTKKASLICEALYFLFICFWVILPLSFLFISESTSRNSVGERINLIKNGLFFLKKSLFIGIGAGNTEYYIGNLAHFDTYGVLNMHNIWIEVLVEGGVLIYTLVVIASLLITKKLIGFCKRRVMFSLIALGMITSMTVGLISPSVAFSNGVTWLYFGVILLCTFNIEKDIKGINNKM